MTEPASMGVPGLDGLLNGGLPRRRLYLLHGEPGTGKTTLALQFLKAGASRGERGLYITLSETEEELRAVAESHGWSLDELHLFELTRVQSPAGVDAQYTLFHPAEVELSETMTEILAEVERSQPKRVVFDSLSEMRLLARDALRYRRQVLALKQFFAGRDCTVMLLDDGSAERGDLQIRSIAHGVIDLENFTPPYGAERRRLRIAKLRGVRYRGGYHDFRIETGGLRVFPRLDAREPTLPREPGLLATGVEGLDGLVGGGLERGSSTVLMGTAGVGKSTIAMHYAVTTAKQGERVAMFLFEERIPTLIARTQGLGLDFATPRDAGLIGLQEVNPAELTPGEFAAAVKEEVEQAGARMVIIDSLNGYLNAMFDEHSLAVHMHELLSYLSRRGVVTLITVAQQGVVEVSPGSLVDMSYLADTVLLLRYFETAGQVRVALSVVKRRGGSHERTIRELRMGPSGLRLSEPLVEFHGVLTGVPSYRGSSDPLLGNDDEQAAA